MNENRVVALRQKGAIDDPLTEILRAGARRLIAQAVEAEFETFLGSNADLVLPDGRQRVVRHGHDPVRAIQTGIGPVDVQKPKARDRGAAAGDAIRFTSTILPKWARRTKSLDALLPVLYLRGVSAGDFQEALAALLGKDAPNLSPAVIARLKSEWEDEYRRWQKRDLSARRYVYVWADGVYLQARMEPQAECMLVLIGATPEGKKELIGFQTGMRESAQSWRELLVDLKARGLVDRAGSRHRRWRARLLESPRRGVPDDASSALLAAQDTERARQASEVLAAQRAQGSARDLAVAEPGRGGSGDDDIRREIRAQIRQGRRMPDQRSETLLTFFDFPADHWDHLRTSNPIESVFATVRHRTVRMKGALSQDTARLMVFKLVMAASKTWRRLRGQNQLPKVIDGVKFKDGIEVAAEMKSAA